MFDKIKAYIEKKPVRVFLAALIAVLVLAVLINIGNPAFTIND